MATPTLPPPPLSTPLAQQGGTPGPVWTRWLTQFSDLLRNVVGGSQALTQATETAPTYAGTWSDKAGKDTGKFFKDSLGMVHVSFWITGGTIGANAFVLPAGYRPAGLKAFVSYSWNGTNQVVAVTTVDASGNVVPAIGANNEFAANFSFRAA